MNRVVVCALLLVSLKTAGFSQSLFSFGVQADLASLNPPDALKDVYGSGYGGGIHVDLHFVPMLRVRGTADYLSFSADANKYSTVLANQANALASSFSVDGGRVGILAFAVNGKYNFPLPFVSPYVTAGLGTASVSVSDITVKYNGVPFTGVPSTGSGTRALWNIGAGVDLDVLMVPLYVEVRYTWLSSQGGQTISYVPVSVGVTL